MRIQGQAEMMVRINSRFILSLFVLRILCRTCLKRSTTGAQSFYGAGRGLLPFSEDFVGRRYLCINFMEYLKKNP